MQRLAFIDSSRGMAVVLAMLSHAFIHFAAFVTFPDETDWLRSILTRTATPTFLVLFGVMIELAYFRKSRDSGDITTARRRLFHRMLICYLLYVAVTLVAMLTQKLTLTQGAAALSFRGTGRFADILKIYTVMFFIAALTYPIGYRRGAAFFLGWRPWDGASNSTWTVWGWKDSPQPSFCLAMAGEAGPPFCRG